MSRGLPPSNFQSSLRDFSSLESLPRTASWAKFEPSLRDSISGRSFSRRQVRARAVPFTSGLASSGPRPPPASPFPGTPAAIPLPGPGRLRSRAHSRRQMGRDKARSSLPAPVCTPGTRRDRPARRRQSFQLNPVRGANSSQYSTYPTGMMLCRSTSATHWAPCGFHSCRSNNW